MHRTVARNVEHLETPSTIATNRFELSEFLEIPSFPPGYAKKNIGTVIATTPKKNFVFEYSIVGCSIKNARKNLTKLHGWLVQYCSDNERNHVGWMMESS